MRNTHHQRFRMSCWRQWLLAWCGKYLQTFRMRRFSRSWLTKQQMFLTRNNLAFGGLTTVLWYCTREFHWNVSFGKSKSRSSGRNTKECPTENKFKHPARRWAVLCWSSDECRRESWSSYPILAWKLFKAECSLHVRQIQRLHEKKLEKCNRKKKRKDFKCPNRLIRI